MTCVATASSRHRARMAASAPRATRPREASQAARRRGDAAVARAGWDVARFAKTVFFFNDPSKLIGGLFSGLRPTSEAGAEVRHCADCGCAAAHGGSCDAPTAPVAGHCAALWCASLAVESASPHILLTVRRFSHCRAGSTLWFLSAAAASNLAPASSLMPAQPRFQPPGHLHRAPCKHCCAARRRPWAPQRLRRGSSW
jgi:hypothetical protein